MRFLRINESLQKSWCEMNNELILIINSYQVVVLLGYCNLQFLSVVYSIIFDHNFTNLKKSYLERNCAYFKPVRSERLGRVGDVTLFYLHR